MEGMLKGAVVKDSSKDWKINVIAKASEGSKLSYHGTPPHNINEILHKGLHVPGTHGVEETNGSVQTEPAIYVTTYSAYAARYARVETFCKNGKKFVLQTILVVAIAKHTAIKYYHETLQNNKTGCSSSTLGYDPSNPRLEMIITDPSAITVVGVMYRGGPYGIHLPNCRAYTDCFIYEETYLSAYEKKWRCNTEEFIKKTRQEKHHPDELLVLKQEAIRLSRGWNVHYEYLWGTI